LNPKKTSWQQALAEAFTQIEDLCRHLKLDTNTLPLLANFKQFPLRVPRGFVACMETGNPNDPLLRQILPLQAELEDYPGYTHDPVGDLNAVAAAGVIHKYQGRVLFIVTGGCAVHCRYCFRRNFPYQELQLSTQKTQQAIEFIAARPDISEIILSGGDPLLLNDEKLAHLFQQLANIPHLKRIRIHSRIPIVLPERITPALLNIFATSKQKLVLVIHANHRNELSHAVAAGCALLKQHNITLLNQSVLLKDVNDNAPALIQLSEQLFAIGVLPYYLHLLDKASGVGHFEIAENQALEIIQHMQRNLPGYLVPKLVKEVAGAAYKITISGKAEN
jgi:L-lysine 2,3-aminomutase